MAGAMKPLYQRLVVVVHTVEHFIFR